LRFGSGVEAVNELRRRKTEVADTFMSRNPNKQLSIDRTDPVHWRVVMTLRSRSRLFFLRRASLLSLSSVLLASAAAGASCATAGHSGNFDFAGEMDSGSSADGTINLGGRSLDGGVSLPSLGGGTASGVCSTAHPCNDFPSAPILDPLGKPSGDPSSLFGNAGAGSTGGGPCLVEPADGALYPKNWLRPRVYWTPGSNSQNVFEVRVHSDFEAHDLVVYTTNNYYALDSATWTAIAKGVLNDAGQLSTGNLVGTSLTFTVRGAASGGGTPAVSNTTKILIAPAIADGALVYWTTASFDNNATDTTLQGFHVGDEGTTTALKSSQVAQQVRAVPVDGGNLTPSFQQVFCIGCHSATPDGNYVAFNAQWPWPIALASIQNGSTGAQPPWLGYGARQNLSPDLKDLYNVFYAPPAVNQIMLGISTFSPAHYQTGDRVLVASIGANWDSTSLTDPGAATGVTSELVWFNLEWNTADGGLTTTGLPVATPCTTGTWNTGTVQPCISATASNGGWGVVQRQGDSKSAGSPSWSHNVDGNTDFIAYSSTNVGTKDGRMDCSVASSCTSDVFVVPYGANAGGAGGAGGTAKGLPGASDPAYNEYYPAWSPDDRLLAFDRVPVNTSMYDQPKAEIYVVPYAGGQGGTPVAITQPFPPPACTKPFAAGVENTWPKWAPNPLGTSADGAAAAPSPQVDAAGNTYYWITFSSIRSPLAQINASTGKPKQQLYVAGVVVDNKGMIHPYAPIYLWNQSYQVNNLIPSWGEFSVPPGQTPPPPPPPPQ
jgi:hypothetical protein